MTLSAKYALLLAASLLACATSDPMPLLNAASRVSPGAKLEVVILQPGFLSNSHAIQLLSEQIIRAADGPGRIAVASVDPKLTRDVLLQALAACPDKGIHDLELIYVGDSLDQQAIEKALASKGAKLLFAPQP